MYINDLSPVAGSTHVDKRKGRGHATGNGKTAGRGHKGNVSVLDKFEDGSVVDVQAILDAGIISKCKYGVKFLGNGEVTKKLTVKAAAFSETAKQKIEAAGGKAEVV